MDIDKQVIKLFKQGVFDNIEWTSYPNKYDDQYLSFVDSWNFPVANLNDNVLGDKKELKEFYRWLGERIELTLNLNKGLTNKQLKEQYEQKRISKTT